MRLAFACPVAVLTAGLLLACGDGQGPTTTSAASRLPACPATQALFTHSPIDTGRIAGWVPLGSVNPPSHTFPTDHQYLYLKQPVTAQALVAPGAVTILRARRTQYSNASGNADYAITFAACGEVQGEFGHVASLEPALLSALGPFDQQCSSYAPTTTQTVTTCSTRTTAVPWAAGAALGTASGLDITLLDSRVSPIAYANPSRWRRQDSGFDSFHVVGMSDYFAEPLRSAIAARVGSFDGRTRRIALPIGGTLAVDRVGTAQGMWLAPGQPTYPEYPHLTIAPDHVDPTRTTIGWGSTLNGLAPQGYQVLALSGSPTPPAQVTPGSGVTCWEVGFSSTDARGIVLVELTDATTLRIEARPGGARRCTDADATTLSAAAVRFVR